MEHVSILYKRRQFPTNNRSLGTDLQPKTRTGYSLKSESKKIKDWCEGTKELGITKALGYFAEGCLVQGILLCVVKLTEIDKNGPYQQTI